MGRDVAHDRVAREVASDSCQLLASIPTGLRSPLGADPLTESIFWGLASLGAARCLVCGQRPLSEAGQLLTISNSLGVPLIVLN